MFRPSYWGLKMSKSAALRSSAFDMAKRITLCLGRIVAPITPLIAQNQSTVLMETPPDGFTCRPWPVYAGRRPQTEINFENVADMATVAEPQLPVQCVFDCPLTSTSSLLFARCQKSLSSNWPGCKGNPSRAHLNV